MKKIILSLTLAIVAVINATAQVKVEVSETVELMAILSRTAGFEEYNLDVAGQYSKDTEEYFASYRQHPIIAYYQDLRAKYGIGFEKVMNMAIHLDIHNGNVIFLGEFRGPADKIPVEGDHTALALYEFHHDPRGVDTEGCFL